MQDFKCKISQLKSTQLNSTLQTTKKKKNKQTNKREQETTINMVSQILNYKYGSTFILCQSQHPSLSVPMLLFPSVGIKISIEIQLGIENLLFSAEKNQ